MPDSMEITFFPEYLVEEFVFVLQIIALGCPQLIATDFRIIIQYEEFNLFFAGIPDLAKQYVRERQPASSFSEVAVGLTPCQLLQQAMESPHWNQ